MPTHLTQIQHNYTYYYCWWRIVMSLWFVSLVWSYLCSSRYLRFTHIYAAQGSQISIPQGLCIIYFASSHIYIPQVVININLLLMVLYWSEPIAHGIGIWFDHYCCTIIVITVNIWFNILKQHKVWSYVCTIRFSTPYCALRLVFLLLLRLYHLIVDGREIWNKLQLIEYFDEP